MCLSHPDASLRETEICHVMCYIKPTDPKSKERWMAFMSTTTEIAEHKHPMPIESKLDSKLKLDIKDALEKDPTKKPNDISKGHGIGYNPMAVSHAATGPSTLASMVYRAKGKDGTSLHAVKNILENFDKIIKNKIDEADRKHSVDDGRDAEVMKLCSPYCRYECHVFPIVFCY